MDRKNVVRWLREALAKRCETPTALARQAGVSQSTLTRFIGREDATMLSLRTLNKLVRVIGYGPSGFEAGNAVLPVAPPATCMPDFTELEAEPFFSADTLETPMQTALIALTETRDAANVWRLRTAALRWIGYLPGDLVVVDPNTVPKAGDVVCAQVSSGGKGTAETIFRIYEQPYLVAAGDDPALRRPIVVDNDRVVIKGVVTRLIR